MPTFSPPFFLSFIFSRVSCRSTRLIVKLPSSKILRDLSRRQKNFASCKISRLSARSLNFYPLHTLLPRSRGDTAATRLSSSLEIDREVSRFLPTQYSNALSIRPPPFPATDSPTNSFAESSKDSFMLTNLARLHPNRGWKKKKKRKEKVKEILSLLKGRWLVANRASPFSPSYLNCLFRDNNDESSSRASKQRRNNYDGDPPSMIFHFDEEGRKHEFRAKL